MWCTKCRNGHINYNYDHCGQCGCTELTSKNPFEEKPKKGKKKAKNEPRERIDRTHEEVEDIVKGRIKPAVMR